MNNVLSTSIFNPKKIRIVVVLLLFLSAASSWAEDVFWDALTSGKVDFSARYRFEHVDDDFAPAGVPLRDANASTIRTTLGYKTGLFHGFSAYGEFEDVTEVFSGDFNNGSNGETNTAAVIDPDGTEVNQAYLSYTSQATDSLFRLGRQNITYRDAPFHRFIGTILWRQNWQTFDAFSVKNTSLPDTTINYAYVWNVNRIFGEDAPEPLSDFESNSHFVNANYSGLPYSNLEGYAYLLDFDNATAFSTQTYGARLSGAYPVNDTIKGLYALEYARQSDYENNPADIDASYFLGEVGANFKLNNIIDSVTLKFNYELLGGNGGADRFVTILGTNHAFQGTADRFLVTPGDGIEDYYYSLIVNGFGIKFVAVYHQLQSDNFGYDYGDEIDLQIIKTFEKHYTVGLKYADYNADANATHLARNPSPTTADVSKIWAWVQFKF